MKNGELSFDDFKNLAKDTSLSKYEKIGFPNSYREGLEKFIFDDIVNKLSVLNENKKTILDIGCGCSDLVLFIIGLCRKNNHTLILVDSKEMLDLIPDESFIIKYEGCFPEIPELFNKHINSVDAIITYSVFHYIFTEGNIYHFLSAALSLLKIPGFLLLGDIPNISKRKRFLQSQEGSKFLENSQAISTVRGATFHNNEQQKIDDSIIFSILGRFRNFGFETYLLPQNEKLPMANRREDVLIVKNQ